MDAVIERFLERPQRIIDIGRSVFSTGFIFLIVGLWGEVVTSSASLMFSLTPSTNSQSGKTLAEIYPSFSTWWIPESLFGFSISLALIAVGLIVALTGKKYKRLLAG